MHLPIWLSTALLLAAAPAPPPGPRPEPPLPEGLNEAPWAGLHVEGCAERLDRAGIDYSFVSKRGRIKTLKAMKPREDYPFEIPPMHCWVPQALQYRSGSEGIEWSGYVMVNCRMALALAELEKIAQEEARRVFGEGRVVTRIKHHGTYNCRRIKAFPWVQSEHSFGNAIDIGGFTIKGVGKINVKKHWRARWPALQPRADFLHALARRLERSRLFSVVLTPGNDDRHGTHFHLDLAM